MNATGRLRTAKRDADEWLTARPRATAVVYFLVLSTTLASAELLLGGRSPLRAALLGTLFGSLYVVIAWRWGRLGEEATAR